MKVYIIAGEPSGDILAARLMIALRKQYANIQFCGIGGESMAEQGFQSLFDIKDLSVMGFWEVLPKLPVILRHMKEVLTDIEQQQPNVIVSVDSWGFVSSVLNKLKKRKIATPKIHYVAPQVWAWKKGRAKKAAKLMNHLMTLLPYEPQYFEKHGLATTFVGHPVIENTADLPSNLEILRQQFGVPENARVLCVLSGSRHNEIKKLSPIFIEVVKRLQQQIPNLYLLIPSVIAMKGEVEKIFADINIPYKIVVGQQQRYAAFCLSEFALAASGTVSLELAACGTPHIIAYKFNYLTNKMIARLATTKYANLINIIADQPIIPEFVLHNCRADLIYPVAIDFLQNPAKRTEQVESAKIILQQLKPQDAMPSEMAAKVVADYL